MPVDNPLNTDSNLFYVQVHDLDCSYWCKKIKSTVNWIDTTDCRKNKVLPTALTIFKAKQIIAKDKKKDEGCTYYLIPATSTPIQIIE